MDQPLEKPRSALGELLFLAVPTIAQMMSYTLMQYLDTWMLATATHDTAQPTAVGQSGLLAFAVISFGVGVLWVVNTLVSQNFGRGRYEDCGRYLWQGIWFGIAYAIILALLLPLFGPGLRLLKHEPRLQAFETTYLSIVIGFSVFKLVGSAFSSFLLAINKSVAVFAATVVGVSCNAIASYIFVFGKFGIPRLGVFGTGWAQNIGVLIETSMLIGFALAPRVRHKFNVIDWKLRWKMLKTLLVVGAPSGVQICADVLAWSLFCVGVLARFGTDAMAANSFMFNYMKVSFMPAFGVAVAVTALVGRYIGRGEYEQATLRAHLGFKLTTGYMLLCAILFFIFRRDAIGLFTNDPHVIAMGAQLMIFAAIYQLFDAMYISYNGALRGAGDTFIPALATGILCWGMVVGGGWAVAIYLPQFGIAGPWTVATLYGVILGVFMLLRFHRGAWKSIRLEDHAHSAKLGAEESGQLSVISGR